MKKTITLTNNEIGAVINALTLFKSRSNITCVPSITMSAIRNVKILQEELKNIMEYEAVLREKYFTEENCHMITDENGNELRALNDDVKEEILKDLTKDLNEL